MLSGARWDVKDDRSTFFQIVNSELSELSKAVRLRRLKPILFVRRAQWLKRPSASQATDSATHRSNEPKEQTTGTQQHNNARRRYSLDSQLGTLPRVRDHVLDVAELTGPIARALTEFIAALTGNGEPGVERFR